MLARLAASANRASGCARSPWLRRVSRVLRGQRGLSGATRDYGGPKLSASPNKAGILIIGDEILSGKVVDVNASWLSKLLYSRGFDVCRIETVGDCQEEIVDSVRRIKARVGEDGPVFTSGGIGPTHDDVTYQAIASAFGCELKVHDATLERMTAHYSGKGLEVNEMRMRMASLPDPCEVLFTEGMWVPLAIVENVHVLPGIPRLFQSMIEAHQERFVGEEFFNIELFSDEGEGDLAAPLADVAARHLHVKIGSYPRVTTTAGGLDGSDDSSWKVRLAIEGRDEKTVLAAADELRKSIRVIDTVAVPKIIGLKQGGATEGKRIPKMVGKPGKQFD
jgi:molybdenum cofactor synthesis domain-containing protein